MGVLPADTPFCSTGISIRPDMVFLGHHYLKHQQQPKDNMRKLQVK